VDRSIKEKIALAKNSLFESPRPELDDLNADDQTGKSISELESLISSTFENKSPKTSIQPNLKKPNQSVHPTNRKTPLTDSKRRIKSKLESLQSLSKIHQPKSHVTSPKTDPGSNRFELMKITQSFKSEDLEHRRPGGRDTTPIFRAKKGK